AQSHALDDGGLVVEHRFADNVGHYPAGFAFSTALDLARFAVMQMNEGRRGGVEVLRPAAIAEMQRRQARWFSLDPEGGYGLTFQLGSRKGARWVGHGGAISAFGSFFQMAPDRRVAVIALFNLLSPDFALDRVVRPIFDEL